MTVSVNNNSGVLRVGESNTISTDLAVDWLDGKTRYARIKGDGQSLTQDHKIIPTGAQSGFFLFGFPIQPHVLLPIAPSEPIYVVTV